MDSNSTLSPTRVDWSPTEALKLIVKLLPAIYQILLLSNIVSSSLQNSKPNVEFQPHIRVFDIANRLFRILKCIQKYHYLFIQVKTENIECLQPHVSL